MLGIIEQMKEQIQRTEVYKSIFRHNYQDTQRNRALQIVDNVFLHLHPVRISRHATNIGYTWGMGGITFLLFIVLTVTGVILMFYYRPAAEYAYDDMKYLMNDVARSPDAQHACWSVMQYHHGDVYMFLVFHRFVQALRQFNGHGALLLTLTFAELYGLFLPWDQLDLGGHRWNHGTGDALLGHEGPFGPELGMRIDNDVRFVLLGGTQVGPPTLLRFYVLHCIFLPLVASIFLVVHFWRVRKDGGISGPELPKDF
jgi:quinol-cytochrome oxidoreductase complex cytochrome b subunit